MNRLLMQKYSRLCVHSRQFSSVSQSIERLQDLATVHGIAAEDFDDEAELASKLSELNAKKNLKISGICEINQSVDWPEGVLLDEVIGCGRGVVADREFQFGEPVFISPPILNTGAQAVETAARLGTILALEKQLQSSIDQMQPSEQNLFFHFGPSKIIDASTFPLSSRLHEHGFPQYLFGFPSFMNHSCFPNVEYDCIDHHFTATRDIKKGEEITISSHSFGDHAPFCVRTSTCACHFGNQPISFNTSFNQMGRIQAFLYKRIRGSLGEFYNITAYFSSLTLSHDFRIFYDSSRHVAQKLMILYGGDYHGLVSSIENRKHDFMIEWLEENTEPYRQTFYRVLGENESSPKRLAECQVFFNSFKSV